MFSLHDLGWESHTSILMFLRKLGRYLCIRGAVKWMSDVLWLHIRCLQGAEIEEWLEETYSCISLGRKMTVQSRSGSGQYLVVDIWAHKYRGMMHSRWWHETLVPVIWSFEDSGWNFISLEAVTQDPGWVSASVITTCQCRFSLPFKSHPLFFTSFVEPLCPPCCCWW